MLLTRKQYSSPLSFEVNKGYTNYSVTFNRTMWFLKHSFSTKVTNNTDGWYRYDHSFINFLGVRINKRVMVWADSEQDLLPL